MSDRVLSVVVGGDEEAPATADLVLGKYLLQLRKQAGLTQKQVVDAGAFSSVSMLSKYEGGKVTVQEQAVIKLVKFLGIQDAEELDELRALVGQARTKEWWSGFSDVVPGWLSRLFSMENSAHQIWTYQGNFVPGLLQTSDYARALMRAPYRRPGSDGVDLKAAKMIERRLTVRLQRQSLLDQANAPDLYVVLDENVLSRPTGGRSVMRGQLRQLYNYGENKSRVHIRVLPFSAAEFVTPLKTAMTLLKFAAGQGGDVVYIECSNEGGTYENEREPVERHKASFEELWAHAMDKEASLKLLDVYANKLR
ncbi:helix-turn-helix transcriptional regulator [Streptomyces sp. NPDC048612]|uniref:helix-turn-helix domain-containing protein n=1 Tax=Streptomyces sp. NPDC048612 TaxID=3365579 RepID=UPI003711577B